MPGVFTTEQLLDAAAAQCNGTLDERTGRQLDDLLAQDPAARRVYINYMWLHASLYADAGAIAAPPALADEAAPTLPIADHQTRSFGRRMTASRGWQLAAASLAIFALGWIAVAVRQAGHAPERHMARRGSEPSATRQSTQPDSARAEAAPQPAAPAYVARITGTHNCIWGDPSSGIGYGSRLAAGQRIELREGLVEVSFEDGATLLLEGPATFDVASSDKVALQTGRLAAVIPQRARGFRVRTRGLEIYEVGTEFGLLAQESGAAEVHAFNGLVKADLLDADGQPLRQIELNSAEAVRINALATTVVAFPADDAKFIRSIIPTSGPHDGLLAEEAFRYPTGPLEAQNGGFGWAGPWFTTSADEKAGPDSNRVQAGSLAANGIVPSGNRAMQSAQYNRIRRQLATSVGGVFDAAGLVENQDELRLVGRDGSVAYISFIQRVSKVDDGFYGVELHRGDGNANRVLCIGTGADGAAYGATSNVNIYGAKNLPSLGPETTEVNFFVIKITFGVDNHDLVEVFRNPASLRDESACSPTATLRGNFAFDRISLANFDGTKVHEVDEIRVGVHFLAVTGRWGNNQDRLMRQLTGSRTAVSGGVLCRDDGRGGVAIAVGRSMLASADEATQNDQGQKRQKAFCDRQQAISRRVRPTTEC